MFRTGAAKTVPERLPSAPEGEKSIDESRHHTSYNVSKCDDDDANPPVPEKFDVNMCVGDVEDDDFLWQCQCPRTESGHCLPGCTGKTTPSLTHTKAHGTPLTRTIYVCGIQD